MKDKSTLSQIKIVMVDDHDLIREGMKVILANNGIENVDCCANASELISWIEAGKAYDFHIIDLELPDMDGFDLIEWIRKGNPQAKIIVSTLHDEIWTLRKLLHHDVNAIVYKSGIGEEFVMAINEIMLGRKYFCESVRERMKKANDSSIHPSTRELEVLYLMAQGKTTHDIATALFVSDNTIEAHRKSLFKKLGAVNAVDLIVKAVEKGYLQNTITLR